MFEWVKWAMFILAIAVSIAIISWALNLSAILTKVLNLPPNSDPLAQTDSEVLASQLEFILTMNSVFLGFLGIIGTLLTWFFKNSLEDAKEVAGKMVRSELDKHIQKRIQDEFRHWEMSARTERVVSQTLVNYYLPDGIEEPREFSLVKNRGFRHVLFCSRLEEVRRSSADVVILDVQNWTTESGQSVVQTEKGKLIDESEQQVKQQIDSLRKMISDHVVLVVYVRGTVNYLYDPQFAAEFVLAANNHVTLLGHAVNGAYVAYGDRIANR
ncbi:MAG: hypothetical protein ACTS2F_07795 [Thainema sp.]